MPPPATPPPFPPPTRRPLSMLPVSRTSSSSEALLISMPPLANSSPSKPTSRLALLSSSPPNMASIPLMSCTCSSTSAACSRVSFTTMVSFNAVGRQETPSGVPWNLPYGRLTTPFLMPSYPSSWKLHRIFFADPSQGLISRIPIVSDIDEARALQFRCECLEAACLQDRRNTPPALKTRHFTDHVSPPSAAIDPIEALRLSSGEGPDGFANWLEKHIGLHDPIVRSVAPKTVRDEPDTSTLTSPTQRQSSSIPSHRCWNQDCVHYIYGFPSQADRDTHMSTHSNYYSKRDSGLSMADTPPLMAQKNPPITPSSAETARLIPPVRLPQRAGSSNPPLLSLQTQPRDRREFSLGFSLPNSRPVTRRGSTESDVDPLLPPLKRSRVGHSRLQSIGELQLLRDNDPCLRCKVSHKAVRDMIVGLEQWNRLTSFQCDSNKTCSFCLEHPASGQEEYWSFLGCYRGPIASFVNILIPGEFRACWKRDLANAGQLPFRRGKWAPPLHRH